MKRIYQWHQLHLGRGRKCGAGQSGVLGGKCGDSSSGRRLTAWIAGPRELTAEHNTPITQHIWRCPVSRKKAGGPSIQSSQIDPPSVFACDFGHVEGKEKRETKKEKCRLRCGRHVIVSPVRTDGKGERFMCVLFGERSCGYGWWSRCQRAPGEAFTRQVSAEEVTGGLPRVCWKSEKVSGCCSRRQARPAERPKSG